MRRLRVKQYKGHIKKLLELSSSFLYESNDNELTFASTYFYLTLWYIHMLF